MNDPDVRQLRYFVAVAEELHFGRAAERLGIAQPPLSRAIKTLERQLGVELLTRNTRQVALTTAGTVLLRDARIALDAVSAAGRRARNAGSRRPVLQLAMKADYDAGLLPLMLDAYKAEPDALPVELTLGGRGEQVPALHDGRADVAIMPLPFDDAGLDWEPLLTEPRMLAISATDPLAGRSRLRLADLAGRLLPDGLPADQEARPASGSSEPARLQVRNLAEIFSLIEIGEIVFFVPTSLARRNSRPDIVYRAVDDLDPSTLAVVWPQISRSPAVAAFVRVASEVAAAAQVDTQPAQALASSG